MSIVLLLAALYGVMRAAMLCFIPLNRPANRAMAGLIAVLALFTFPYIIGYAGYFDAYPWLSFFPYNLTLAIGPLLFVYLSYLLEGKRSAPPRWRLHLLPAFVQFVYYCVIFSRPLAFKNAWDGAVHVPYIDPAETLALLASMSAYGLLAWRHYRSAVIDGGGLGLDWPRNLLIGYGLTLLSWVALAAAEVAWSGLTYFQRFPFYLWLAILVCYLGTEAYRQGIVPRPAPAPAADPAPAPAATAPVALMPERIAPTQAEIGERWRGMVVEGAWWRDPDLDLAGLARRLGTNTTALSRAINEGLGLNFNEMINRLRVEAIVAAMQHGDANQSVLDIAMTEGFNSKASFNRAFKLYIGETPTEYRRRQTGPAHVSTSA